MAEPARIRLTLPPRSVLLLAALAALTLLRLAVAGMAPLAPDEAYYWIFSRALAPGYMDHPPMVALWIRAGTALAGQGALGVRLLGPLASALGTLLLFDAARRLFGRGVDGPLLRPPPAPAAGASPSSAASPPAASPPPVSPPAGMQPAASPPAASPSPAPAAHASPPRRRGPKPHDPVDPTLGSRIREDAESAGDQAGITAGALLSATLLTGVGAVVMTPDTPLLFFWTACLWALARLLHSGRPAWWLAIGLFAGLALVSKYTAVLLWLGIGMWLLWVPSQRHWWRSPLLWAGTAVGALCFVPVVQWNAAHGWASFLRQGGRVDAWHPARAGQFLGELIGGQIGLATPLVFLMLVAGTAIAARRAWRDRDPVWSLLAALTLPGAALFLQHAVGDRVQGNWPAILYPAAAIAAAGLDGKGWRRMRKPAVVLGLVMTALVYLQAGGFLLTLPGRIDPIGRELAGWDGLAESVDTIRRTQGAGFVAVEEYGVAAELARALPADVAVLGADPRWRLFNLPPADVDDVAGILVARAGGDTPKGWREATPIDDVQRSGRGGTVQTFSLWRVSGPLPTLPLALLPRYAPSF